MSDRKHSPRPLTGFEVYIYRNFYWPARRDQHIKLHLGRCRCCENGRGIVGTTPLVDPENPPDVFPKCAYIGPFSSILAANEWLAGFAFARGQRAERCQVCLGVPDSVPRYWC